MTVYVDDDFTGTNGDPPNSSKWTLDKSDVSQTGQIQSNKFRMSLTSTAFSYVEIIAKPDPMSAADYEIRCSFTNPTDSADCVTQIQYRKSAGVGYLIGFSNVSGVWNLASSTDYVSFASGTVASVAGDTIHFRVQVEGTTHRVKAWLNAASEPGPWDAVVTNSVHSSAGSIGFSYYNNNAVAATQDWDDISITSIPPIAKVVGTAATTTGTSMGASRALTMPSGIVAGELLIAQVANDSAVTLTTASSGWAKLDGYNNAAVSGAVFAKVAAGGDTITVANGAAQDYAAIVYRVENHGVTTPATDLTIGTSASGTSATPNPPNCNPGTSAEYLWLEGFIADDDDNTATYWSTGFTGITQAESAQSTSSVMTSAAWIHATASSLDPGTMAMAASEEWWAFTIAVPPLTGATSVTPSTLSTTTTLTAPSVAGGAGATPSTLAVGTTLTTPAVAGGAGIAQTTLSTSTTLTTPTVAGGAGVSQATLSVTTSLPTPTITAVSDTPANITQSALSVGTTLATPTVTGGAGVTQTALSVTTSLPTPTVSGGASKTQTALSVTTSLPTPTVGVGVAATPSTLAVTTTLSTPTVTGGAGNTQSALSTTTALATPSVTVGVGITQTALSTTTTLGTPTVAGGASKTQTALATTTALATPTVAGASSNTQTALSVTTTLTTPAVAGGASFTQTTLSVTTSFPTPTVTTSGADTPADVTQTALSTTTTLTTPAVAGGASKTQTALAVSTSLPAPTVAGGASNSQTALSTSVALPSPTVAGGAGVAQATLSVTASFPTPTIGVGVSVSTTTLSVTTAFPPPGVVVPSVETAYEVNPNRRKRGNRRPKRDAP